MAHANLPLHTYKVACFPFSRIHTNLACIEGAKSICKAVYSLYESYCQQEGHSALGRKAFTHAVKTIFPTVKIDTRRVREGNRKVAYRVYVNVNLIQQTNTGTSPDLISRMKSSKPDKVFLVEESDSRALFSIKTGHTISGIATTKDLSICSDGTLSITCMGKIIGNDALDIDATDDAATLWSTFLSIRPCIGYQCSATVTGCELWQLTPTGTRQHRRRSRYCVGHAAPNQHNDTCLKCINSRPQTTVVSNSTGPTPAARVSTALREAGCSEPTNKLVSDLAENASKAPSQKRWRPEYVSANAS